MQAKASYKIEDVVELDGYALPRSWEVEFVSDDDHPDLTMQFQVSDEGRVECRSAMLTAKPEGREIRLQDFRSVRVGDFLETAVQLVAIPVSVGNENGPTDIAVIRMEMEARGPRNPRSAVHAVNKRRLRVTPARLAEVAEIVSAAKGMKESPVEAVEEAFDVQRRAAQLWIKRARDTTNPATGRPFIEDGSR